LFALNALLGTENGDTFTFAEYCRWLSESGFTKVELLLSDERNPVIAAVKE
jgi:hypothetical protein